MLGQGCAVQRAAPPLLKPRAVPRSDIPDRNKLGSSGATTLPLCAACGPAVQRGSVSRAAEALSIAARPHELLRGRTERSGGRYRWDEAALQRPDRHRRLPRTSLSAPHASRCFSV